MVCLVREIRAYVRCSVWCVMPKEWRQKKTANAPAEGCGIYYVISLINDECLCVRVFGCVSCPRPERTQNTFRKSTGIVACACLGSFIPSTSEPHQFDKNTFQAGVSQCYAAVKLLYTRMDYIQ